jgi:hypothetical protein
MARSLDLIVNTQNSSLLSSFNSTSLSPSTLNFIFGDTTPITVRLVEPSESDVRPWRDIDLTGQLVRVAIGSPGGLPTAGTFTLSYDGDTTAELTHAATAAQISAALNDLASIIAAGGVSVSSARTGIYRIVFTDAGVTEEITASTASLYPTTAAFIAAAQEGAVENQAVFIVRLEVQPAAYLELTDDFPAAAINVTATREGDVGISEIQSLFLNPAPYGGIYNLSYDGEQTADIAWDATAATIQAALAALASPDLVDVTVTGDFPLYNVVFSSGIGAVPLITGDGSALLVPTGRSGSISINTTGVVELLSGSSRADVTFEVELVDEITGESWTPLQNPAVFREDLIPSTPAAQTTGPVYLLESVANTRYLRFDAAQTLTTPQKAQAVANLGLGTAATSKTTPVDADEIPITDSAASFGLKKLTFANLKTALNTLYVALTGNQTIAGDKTFSGQTELTGQAATNSTSAMTRDLVRGDVGVLEYRTSSFAGTGASTAISGSGSMSGGPTISSSSPQCGATTGGYALQRHGSFLNMSEGVARGTVNFAKKFHMKISSVSVFTGTLNEARWQWPVPSTQTTGALPQGGFGFKMVGSKLYGIAHNGTSESATTSFASPSNVHRFLMEVKTNGVGTAEFFVNGSSLGTLSIPTSTVVISGGNPVAINVTEAFENSENMYAIVYDWKIKSW